METTDAPVREALTFLVREGYLLEYDAAFELTERGDREAHGDTAMAKHGACVYRVGATLLVKQTVLRGTPPEYVIDNQRERHIRADDDASLAAAIRYAVSGRL